MLVEAVVCLFKGARPDLSWLTQHESLPVPSTPWSHTNAELSIRQGQFWHCTPQAAADLSARAAVRDRLRWHRCGKVSRARSMAMSPLSKGSIWLRILAATFRSRPVV